VINFTSVKNKSNLLKRSYVESLLVL